MRVKQLTTMMAIAMAAGFVPSIAPVAAQEGEAYPLEARVWLDRGQDPVLQRGETARLYYRVSEDAFVSIFHIDTNGTIRMVFPNSPQENHFARGGRDYRVLFPGSSSWHVNDDPGMGYFFLVASPQPFNFSDLRYSHYDGGWDLSFVGRQVYRDPYLAMDDYVAALIPDWEYVAYGLDFTSYSVDQRYEYPRFMCYDCHGFRPYNVWNPYHYSCSTFRVVIYNDPYYYPVTRYRGTRVVYTQPRTGVPHFAFKERAAGEPGTPQVVVRNPPGGDRPGVDGTATRRAQPRPGTTVTSAPGRATGGSPGTAIPGVERGAARRPSSTGTTSRTPAPIITPRRGTTGGANSGATSRSGVRKPSTATPPTSGGGGRPVLERRPPSTSGGTPTRTTPPKATRPSAKVRRGGGSGSGLPTVRRGGGSGTTRTTNPPRTTTSRPTVRSGGSGTTARPRIRSATPPRATTSRPTTRSTPPRARTSRPPVRSTTSKAKPPTKKRRGGGGGGG